MIIGWNLETGRTREFLKNPRSTRFVKLGVVKADLCLTRPDPTYIRVYCVLSTVYNLPA